MKSFSISRPSKGASVLACIGVGAALMVARGQYVDPTFQCAQYERQTGRALLTYIQDYDGNFPPDLSSSAALQHYIAPYVHNAAYLNCPDTGRPYIANPALAGRNIAAIDAEHTALIKDSYPHRDGLYTVEYVDTRILHGGKYTETTVQCMENARDVSVALSMYAQDYNQTYPVFSTYQEFDRDILPYEHSSWKLTCPDTGHRYMPNFALSGATVNSIAYPAGTVAVYDPVAHTDGDKTTSYLDGHAVHGTLQAGRSDAAPDQICVLNVKQVNLSLMMYIQDYDQTYPPMNSASQFQTLLQPYTRNPQIFYCPITRFPYTPNASLSYVNAATLASPATTITLNDAKPHPDGRSTYGYADGHARLK